MIPEGLVWLAWQHQLRLFSRHRHGQHQEVQRLGERPPEGQPKIYRRSGRRDQTEQPTARGTLPTILLLVLTRRVSGRRQDHPDDAQQEHPLRQLVPEQVLRRQLLRQPQSRESLRVRPGLPPVSTESCRTHNRGQRCARVRPRDPQHGSPLQEKRRSSQIPVSCSCFASQLSTTPHLSTEVWKVFSTVIDCVQRKLSHGWRV
jgi:hypothetical protein